MRRCTWSYCTSCPSTKGRLQNLDCGRIANEWTLRNGYHERSSHYNRLLTEEYNNSCSFFSYKIESSWDSGPFHLRPRHAPCDALLVMALPLLLRLPAELHLNIIERLELHTKARLAVTCRYFRFIILPLSFAELATSEVGEWATARSLFACKDCNRLRHMTDFADGMRKGKRSRHGVEAHLRVCLDCGMKVALYRPGMTIAICHKAHIVCSLCGTLKEQIVAANVCTTCSPDLDQHHSSKLNNRSWQHDFSTSRSARLYARYLQPADIDSAWPDA